MKLVQRILFVIGDHKNAIVSYNFDNVDLLFSISASANSYEIENIQ